jgi:hypothetical protein
MREPVVVKGRPRTGEKKVERRGEPALKTGPFYDRQKDGAGNLASSTLVCALLLMKTKSPGSMRCYVGSISGATAALEKKLAVNCRHRHRQSTSDHFVKVATGQAIKKKVDVIS